MQDQGKRLLLAVVLALGVLLLWQKFFSPPSPPPGQGSGSGAGSGANPLVITAKPVSPVGWSNELPADPKAETTVLQFPHFTATFSAQDATLVGWKLADNRYDADATHGELVPGDAGDFLVGFTKDSTFKIPKHALWTTVKKDAQQVVYKLVTDDLEITKTFDVVPEAFVVRMTIAVAPKLAAGREAHEALGVLGFIRQDPKAEGGSSRIAARIWVSSTSAAGTLTSTEIKEVIAHPRMEPNIQWTGFEHPFLLVAFAPRPLQVGSMVDKHTYADATGLVETDLVYQPQMFKAGDPAYTREIVAFMGPKNLEQLHDADAEAGFPAGFSGVIDMGWFGFLSKPLLWLLKWFHSIVGNWGIAIVMLTILVKGATFYWTTKSMRSMKAMAVLGPQLKGLQEKYKGDKQRLQVETMALYKENGANPLSGCLPMVLQMPIWLALYRMLSTAGELYRQPLIHGWIDDLTAADPTYVLPVVLLVTMFAQARLTPQNPDPSQRTQQMLMQYGMPLMFGGMSIWFPSGLTLYIFTNTCLSALQSIYINKYDAKSIALSNKIKANQLAALQAKTDAKNKGAVASAKDANPKSDDKGDKGDGAGNDKPRPAGQGQKKKKGRR